MCVCVCLSVRAISAIPHNKMPKNGISALWQRFCVLILNVSFQSYGYFPFILYLKSAILLCQWACAKGYVHLAYAFEKLTCNEAWNVNIACFSKPSLWLGQFFAFMLRQWAWGKGLRAFLWEVQLRMYQLLFKSLINSSLKYNTACFSSFLCGWASSSQFSIRWKAEFLLDHLSPPREALSLNWVCNSKAKVLVDKVLLKISTTHFHCSSGCFAMDIIMGSNGVQNLYHYLYD